eukprot:scaffold19452_cov49-Phaeocystis_antarctica.AAC.5
MAAFAAGHGRDGHARLWLATHTEDGHVSRRRRRLTLLLGLTLPVALQGATRLATRLRRCLELLAPTHGRIFARAVVCSLRPWRVGFPESVGGQRSGCHLAALVWDEIRPPGAAPGKRSGSKRANATARTEDDKSWTPAEIILITSRTCAALRAPPIGSPEVHGLAAKWAHGLGPPLAGVCPQPLEAFIAQPVHACVGYGHARHGVLWPLGCRLARTGKDAGSGRVERTWMQALKDGRVIFRKTSEGDRTRLVPRGDAREVAEAGIAAARRAEVDDDGAQL